MDAMYGQLTIDDFITDCSDHFGNRKDLLDSMTLYGTSLLLSSMVGNMDKERLEDADYWYNWLKIEVDDNGEPLV